jgi:hypothetical protein
MTYMPRSRWRIEHVPDPLPLPFLGPDPPPAGRWLEERALPTIFPAFGGTDNAVMINQALSDYPAVRLIPNVPYQVFSPLSPLPGQVIASTGYADINTFGNSGSAILQAGSTAGFNGLGIIQQNDVGLAPTQGNYLLGLAIDGTGATGTVDALQAVGPIVGNVIVDCSWQKVTNWGINTIADTNVITGNQHPFQWYVRFTTLRACAGGGVNATFMTDSEWIGVKVRGCGNSGNHGWVINNWPNSVLTSCRSEFTGTNHGFRVTGAWTSGGTAQNADMLIMEGCSTDRSNGNGILIDSTGNSVIILNGCKFHRDGSNGGAGGGNFAGIAVVGATTPVMITGAGVMPGVNDDGSGTNSPQIGLQLVATNTLVAVTNAMFHAATTGINGASGASYRNVWTRTGTAAAPTAPALTADTA